MEGQCKTLWSTGFVLNLLDHHVQVLGRSHVLHEAVNQHLLAACWADAPCSALQTQVLHAEGLDRLQSHVDGVVHDGCMGGGLKREQELLHSRSCEIV